ncbi:MAG: hypothetical protein GIKADHBN_00456 [Phycisphaerales bacterium]|nr:hypothetical protein [Phycisphaerales bacterium]
MRSTQVRAALLAGVCGVAAAASQTGAAVVVFDNSAGVFEWKLSVRLADGQTASLGTFLDITQPATQSGEFKPGAFGQWFRWNSTGSEPALRFFEGAQHNDSEQLPTIKQTLLWNGMTIKPYTIRQYEAGESTSPDHLWEWQGTYFFHLPFNSSLSEGTPAIDTLAYLGARVKKNGKYHYGWILFQDYTTPIAWAYETTPDTMITVPAPVASIVVGMPLLIGRRRR